MIDPVDQVEVAEVAEVQELPTSRVCRGGGPDVGQHHRLGQAR